MSAAALHEERLEAARREIWAAIDMRRVRPKLVLYPARISDTLGHSFNELAAAKFDAREGDDDGAKATAARVRRRLERISPRVPLGVAEHLDRASEVLR